MAPCSRVQDLLRRSLVEGPEVAESIAGHWEHVRGCDVCRAEYDRVAAVSRVSSADAGLTTALAIARARVLLAVTPKRRWIDRLRPAFAPLALCGAVSAVFVLDRSPGSDEMAARGNDEAVFVVRAVCHEENAPPGSVRFLDDDKNIPCPASASILFVYRAAGDGFVGVFEERQERNGPWQAVSPGLAARKLLATATFSPLPVRASGADDTRLLFVWSEHPLAVESPLSRAALEKHMRKASAIVRLHIVDGRVTP